MAAHLYSSSTTSSSSPVIPINTEPTSTTPSLIVLNAASQAPLRLSSTTYFPWRVQWDALLVAYDFYGYVDGSLPCPAQPNPSFLFWVWQDKFILNALLASINQDLSHLVSSAKMSSAVWIKLANTFATPSRPHLLRLRERLIKPQGHRSITDYLLDVKTAADELALLNHPIENNDLILYIVNGLSPQLKDISAAICTRSDSISFEELHEHLVEHDSYLHRMDTHSDSSPVTANVANKIPSGSFPPPRRGPWNTRQPYTGTSNRSHGPGRSTPYKGKCQLCNQQGHSTRFCPSFKEQWTYSPPKPFHQTRAAPMAQAYYSNPLPQVSSAPRLLGSSPQNNWIMNLA